jgi:nucleosome binding factor SPN SPT16 subunit
LVVIPASLLCAHLLLATPQKKVGVFAKDKPKGKFTDEWDALLTKDGNKDSFETVDVSAVVASIMAVKEADEIVRFQALVGA